MDTAVQLQSVPTATKVNSDKAGGLAGAMVAKPAVKKRGLILLNLGTPKSTHSRDVGAYLREFLMDPWVVDIAGPLRWFLVNFLIVPRRSRSSAQLYRKIWTERGSPLLFHLLDLTEKVQNQMGNTWCVKPAMRYGMPSIEAACCELKAAGITDVHVFPLYPQYSLAATESSMRRCRKLIREQIPEAKMNFVSPFYSQSVFVDAFARQIRASLTDFAYDYLLFSFHGLPERQIKKTNVYTHKFCQFSDDCCSKLRNSNRNCYRAQCFETARLIANELGLDEKRYGVSFQSRLGRTPWIKPYTDFVYDELGAKGIKRLAVCAPSFVADCLETLEEIQIRGKNQFIRSGGEDLRLIPSLNSSEPWVSAVCQLVQKSQA